MMNTLFLRTLAAAFALGALAVQAEEDPYADVRPQIESCAACHGAAGAEPMVAEYPILAGQHMYYLYTQLKDFAANRRENAVMHPIASALDREQMKRIATYFSEQSWPGNALEATAGEKAAATQLISSGQCVQCHLGGFQGTSGVPRTAGQNAEYLQKTLMDFKHRRRNNAPDKATLLATFSDEQLKSLAKYFSTLP